MSLVTAAVAWVLDTGWVSSAIIGASRPEQLPDHFKATDVKLAPGLKQRLDQVWFNLPRRPPDLDTPRLGDFYEEIEEEQA